MNEPPWSLPIRLVEFAADKNLALTADEPTRARIADSLDLASLDRFEATVKLKPWLDGGEIRGSWSADVVQTCGVTLDPFETPLKGVFTVYVLPAGSKNAPDPEAELPVDPEADDPPDLLESDVVDVGAYLVEHLALELDPFPRKPGVEFEPPPEIDEPSPFAALARFKREGGSVS